MKIFDAAAVNGTPLDPQRVQRRTVWVLSSAQLLSGVGSGASLPVGSLLAVQPSGSTAWAGSVTTVMTLESTLPDRPLDRPNGHIQVRGVDGTGQRQYLYHSRCRELKDREKFECVLASASGWTGGTTSRDRRGPHFTAKDLRTWPGTVTAAGAGWPWAVRRLRRDVRPRAQDSPT
ncbi:hypothetical protein [Arthrobacter sp. AL12]|uniref:hypothetical protein n=1 Tax=Arthrobacter sp. AL12 TaxID=3042241 RepID=UPI00249B9F9A|nr:hypothetical protein [Arthrobacter sp. AL12]MDI3211107.1 hypothetical protein [Arthrobacter sp. AL12]